MGGRSGVGLTPRQARFVDEYLIDLNATQAAIRAGYSAKTAQTQSSRLLSNVMVQAAILDGMAERHTKSVMSAVEALERASTIARLDIRQFYRADRSLKDVSEWTPAMGAQVSRIDTCQGRSKIRPPWRRKTRPLGSWVEWRNAAVRRGRQDAGVVAGWRAFLLCSRR